MHLPQRWGRARRRTPWMRPALTKFGPVERIGFRDCNRREDDLLYCIQAATGTVHLPKHARPSALILSSEGLPSMREGEHFETALSLFVYGGSLWLIFCCRCDRRSYGSCLSQYCLLYLLCVHRTMRQLPEL